MNECNLHVQQDARPVSQPLLATLSSYLETASAVVTHPAAGSVLSSQALSEGLLTDAPSGKS